MGGGGGGGEGRGGKWDRGRERRKIPGRWLEGEDHIRTCIHVYVHTYVCMYIHTYRQTDRCTYVHFLSVLLFWESHLDSTCNKERLN